MNSDSSDSAAETPKKKNKRIQKFKKEWMGENLLKMWLKPVAGDVFKAFCSFCNTSLKAELYSLKQHAKSSKHKMRERNIAGTSHQTIQNFFSANIDTERERTDLIIKKSEIRVSGFIAEHNISFRSIDHLVDMIREVCPDSTVAKKLRVKCTKSKNIIKNVIGEDHKCQLTSQLQTELFSVLIDELTDISSVQTLCIVVRFFDGIRIASKFWELTQVFGQTGEGNEAATAEHLFNVLMETFRKRKVPISNIIGFASDGCNTMMGAHNSVSSRFRNECPGITIYKCICHSLHLCASEACKQLPRSCEDLSRNVYNFFHSSSKRQSHFMKFQAFLEIDIHKILRPSQTRWLSLYNVVNRIVEQWDALVLFFNEKWLEERLIATEQIFHSLNDPLIKLFYLFLEWVLPKFSELNKYFQSDRAIITTAYENMAGTYKELLCSYMKKTYVMQTPLEEIDPSNKNQYKDNSTIYVGIKVMSFLNKPDVTVMLDLKNDFYSRVVHFLSVSCLEIKKRFDFSDPILKSIHIFNPRKSISHLIRDEYPTLLPLMICLPRIVNEEEFQNIDDEWRHLPFCKLPEQISLEDDVDIFWGKLLNFKNEGDSYIFKNVSKFVLNVLSLPISNAECERVFSKVNLIKTKQRNRLVTSTLNGTLLARQSLHMNDGCHKFTVTDGMLSRMTKEKLYGTTNGDEDEADDIVIPE